MAITIIADSACDLLPAEAAALDVKLLPIASIGCAIGTHVGPGAVAVAYFEKEA